MISASSSKKLFFNSSPIEGGLISSAVESLCNSRDDVSDCTANNSHSTAFHAATKYFSKMDKTSYVGYFVQCSGLIGLAALAWIIISKLGKMVKSRFFAKNNGAEKLEEL
jgi:hypothetical protein